MNMKQFLLYMSKGHYRWPALFTLLVLAVLMFVVTIKRVDMEDELSSMEIVDILIPVMPEDIPEELKNDGDAIVEGKEDDPDSLAGIVDASFSSEISMPRPLGGMVKVYPPRAKESGVEALVRLLLVIGHSGKVEQASVVGVVLKQRVAAELSDHLKNEFAHNALETVKNARYTVTVYQGKPVSVRIEETIDFSLR